MTSTIELIGRTPAACSRAAIHFGDGPTWTSASAAAYRGHSSSSSIDHSQAIGGARRHGCQPDPRARIGGGQRERQVERGGDLARQAEHTQAVRDGSR